MALFSKDTQKKEAAAASSGSLRMDRSNILKHSRITEKATVNEAKSVYVFNVAASATKRDIVDAMRDLYKVVPVKVAIAKIPTKKTRSARTGIVGVKRGGKKAYVYLKKGETISIS